MFSMTRPNGRAAVLNRLVDQALGSWPTIESDGFISSWLPPMDVLEDKDAVRIVAEVPGMRADDVKIQVENGVLTIHGERRYEARNDQERFQRSERAYGAFARSFVVPTSVDAERISAACDNGLLTITLPKAERAKPRAISVEVRHQ